MDVKKIPEELNGDLASRIRETVKAAVAGVDRKVAEVKAEESEIRADIERHTVALEKMKKKRRRSARKARRDADAKAQLLTIA